MGLFAVSTKIFRRMVGGLPLLGTAFLVVCLAGCAGNQGSGVASAGGAGATPSQSGPPPAANTQDRLRQYAQCLRQHGVQAADPDQGKGVRISTPNDPQAKVAAEACQQYAVGAANGSKAAANIPQDRAYAACMRQHGLPNFPDPDPNNGLVVPKSVLDSPGYDSASRACDSSVGKNGNSTP